MCELKLQSEPTDSGINDNPPETMKVSSQDVAAESNYVATNRDKNKP